MSGIRINEIPRDSILDGKTDLVHIYKEINGTFKSVAAPLSAVAFQGPVGNPGSPGTNGIDGNNGKSIAQLVCYRRFPSDATFQEVLDEKPGAADADGNYNDDGSFNFTNRIFDPPDEWSGGVPVIEIGQEDWVLYSCNGVASIDGVTNTDEIIVWSDPVADGIQGLPGSDGKSTYQAVVFTRKPTVPSPPIGGSFDFGSNRLTPPEINDGNGNVDDWYIDVAGDLGPPAEGAYAGTQLWMCNFQFSITGDTGTSIATTWSQPTRFASDGADGYSTYFGSIYTRTNNDIRNDKPGGIDDTTSGTYSFTSNEFIDLPDGWTEAIPEYDGQSLWVSHTVATVSGPTGEDSSLSWSSPVKVMQPAIDGNNGDAVVQLSIYTRAIGFTEADTPTGGSFNFQSRILTPPSGWSSAPYRSVIPDDDPDAGYDFLYVSVGVAATSEYDVALGNYGIDSDITWSAPILSPNEGINGISTYLSQVYTRYAGDEDIQTLTNAPTGGSYNFSNSTLTVPNSASGGEALTWYDRIPGGLAPIYISQQQFGIIGNTGTAAGSDNWSAPAIMAYNGTAGFDGVTNKLITLYYGADTELATIPVFPIDIDLTVQLDVTEDTFGKIIDDGDITISSNQIISGGNATGWYTQIPTDAEWVYATEAIAADSNETDLIKVDVIGGNEWSDTVLWRKPGSNGLVGLATGPVRLYLRNNNINAPSTTPTGPINYYVQNSGSNSRGDLVVPAGSSLNGWSLLEPSYDGTNHYLWSIVATSSTREVYDIIEDDEWSEPFIYSQNPFDLTETVVSHIVQAYKRSSLPVTDNPGTVTVDLSGTNAGLIQEASLDNGWSKVIPDGDQQLYITHATASGNVSINDGTETDIISADEWSDGSRWGIKGDPGNDGAPGYNTTPVAIYKRTDRSPAATELNPPADGSTYNFSNKAVSFTTSNGWSSTEPVKQATDKILWQRWATAIDTGTGSDTIASDEWGPAINIGEDGLDGTSFIVKGTVDAISNLPTDAAEGDAYIFDGDLYVWDGTSWVNIGDIQGPAGEVGAASYLHIKYASSVTYNSSGDVTAVVLTDNNGEDIGDYIGTHVSSTEADPTVNTSTGAPYKWKLLQGSPGRTAGTIAYAAYSNSDPDTITYDSTENALVLQSDTDYNIGMAYPAFDVSDFAGTDKKIKFDIPVKSSSASVSGFYIRVYEYDDVLPAGKLAINGSPNPAGGEYGAGNSPEVQLGTRIRYQTPRFENQPISTDYEIKSFEYIPTSTAKYASIVILNWTGMGLSELYVKPVIGNIVGGSGADGIPGQTPVVINVYKKVGLGAPAPDAPGAGTYDKDTGVFTFNSNASNGWSVTTPNAESGKRIYITSATVIYPANSTTGTVSVPGTSWANIIDGKATVTWSSVPGRTAPAVSRIADYKYLNLYLAGIYNPSPWSNGQYYFGKSGTLHFGSTVDNMVAGDSIDDITTLGFSLKSSSGADMSQFISDTELTQEILFKQGASWILFKRLSAVKNVPNNHGQYIDVEVVDKSENLSTISDLEYIAAGFTDANTLPTGAEVAAIFGYTPAIARDTVYLYQRSDSTTVPGDPTGDYSYNFNTETLTLENGAANGWSSTIDGSNGKYLWRLHATASGTIDSGSNVFTDTITPSEWSVMLISQDGIDGATGTSFSQKFLYTRTATSTPTFLGFGWNNTTQPVQLQVAVANTGSDTIGRVRSTDANDLVRTGVTWFEDIPDQTNGDHLWVIVAPVISTGTNNYVTIPNTAWAEPVKLSQNGVGLNTATVRLYKRTAGPEPTAPAPTNSLTYNFLNGNLTDITTTQLAGWSKGIPSTGGNTLYVIRAIASSISTVDSIGTDQWSAPEVLLTDGTGMVFIGGFSNRATYIEYIDNSQTYNGIPPVNSYHIEPEVVDGSNTERKVSLLYTGGQNTTDKNNGANFVQLTIDGRDGLAGRDGVDGSSFTFKGTFSSAPTSAVLGDMYKNSVNNIVYVYDGDSWQVLVSDGTDGADSTVPGPDGKSIFVAYHNNLLTNQPIKPVATSNGNTNGWSTTSSSAANWMSQKIAQSADEAGIYWSNPIKISGEVGEAGYKTVTLTCYRRAGTLSNAATGLNQDLFPSAVSFNGGYDFDNQRFAPPTGWSSTVLNAASNATGTKPSNPVDGIGWEWDANLTTISARSNASKSGLVLWSTTTVATVQTTADIQRDTSLNWSTPQLQTLNGIDLIDDSVSVDRVNGAVKNGGGVQKMVATDRNNAPLTQAAYDALGVYSDPTRGDYGWLIGDGIDPETFYIIF